MKNFSNLKRLLSLLSLLLLLGGCGYKPSSKFAREIVGEKISTDIIVALQDPENTVLIKDAVDKAVIEVFRASLVDKSVSDTHLVIKISSSSHAPVVYDENGFVIGYRMKVVLNIVKHSKNESKNYIVRGFYDFSVAPNAIVTDQDRFEAIESASQKAINSFIAQVSAQGARAKK